MGLKFGYDIRHVDLSALLSIAQTFIYFRIRIGSFHILDLALACDTF